MTLFDAILTLITILSAFTVIHFCYKQRKLKYAKLGMAIGILSILYCANPILSWYKMKNLKYSGLNESETQSASGVPMAHGIPTRWTGEALLFDLTVAGKSIQNYIDEAGQKNKLLIFSAENGILPEYQAWAEKEFGKILPVDSEINNVCFRRQPEVPYASGICREFKARYSLVPSASAYAISSDGKNSFIHLKQSGLSRYGITTISLDGSPETLCLSELSKGSACAGVEILPDGALSVLFLEATDPIQKHVMEEFKVPDMSLGELHLQNSDHQFNCGGFDLKNNLTTITHTSLKTRLSQINSENELTEVIQDLNSHLPCPGPISLEVPVFLNRKLEPTTRSFLTQVLEKPFWVTPPASYFGRKQKIEKTELFQDGYKLVVKSPIEIKNFAITIMSPVTFDEEILHFIKPSNINDFKIYRIGATTFRLVSNLVKDLDFSVDTAPLLRGTSASNASTVSDWTGFNRSMLFALSLALIISWLQGFATARTEKQVFFPMTFFYICFIGLLWFFLSSRASYLGDQGVANLTEERLSDPQYITVRDWNENWWKKDLEDQEVHQASSQSNNASWRAEVELARKASNSNIPTAEAIKFLDLNPSANPKYLSQVRIQVWDAPEVRNWYFRKSPSYASALTAWQSLLQFPEIKGEIDSSATLDFNHINHNTIIVVLDYALLSESNQKALNDWISNGGTAVFHTALDSALSKDPELFQKKNYSKIPDAFGVPLEINRTHFIQSKTGDWFNIKKIGSGRKVFAGVVPYQTNSLQLLKELLHGLNRSSVVVNSFHDDGCHTAIFAEPYGASSETLRSFSNHLKATGVNIQWAISAESFARMAPEWKNTFTPQNIAFLDDGKPIMRAFSTELYQRFFKVTSKPVFITIKDEKPNLIGPEALLVRAEVLESVDLWESSCITGVSRPRLLTSNEIKNSIGIWQNKISSLKTFHFQTGIQLLDNAPLLSSPGKRKWISNESNPMKYAPERTSP